MDISPLFLTPIRLGVAFVAIAAVVAVVRRRRPSLPPPPASGRPRPVPPDLAGDAGFSVPVSMTDYDWAVRLYQPRPLLSVWERRVLDTLRMQVPRGYHVCPQVRMADFIVPRGPDSTVNRQAFFKIASKSIDFVVVDEGTGAVVLGIELDDATHARPERQYRDGLGNAAFAHVRIPLLRLAPGARVDVTRHFHPVPA